MDIDYQSLSGVLLYLVSFLIVFSETGVFFLFFLPGDSLLFALGLLANQGVISIWYLIPLLIIAAICGNFLGYFFGRITRGGLEQGKYLPKVKKEHLDRAKNFYEKYGSIALLLSRFIPILRTFVPYVAGVVVMRKRAFTLWSIIGAIAWIVVVTLIGYFFGKQFNLENVAHLGSIVVIAAVVATPIFIGLIKRFMKER